MIFKCFGCDKYKIDYKSFTVQIRGNDSGIPFIVDKKVCTSCAEMFDKMPNGNYDGK